MIEAVEQTRQLGVALKRPRDIGQRSEAHQRHAMRFGPHRIANHLLRRMLVVQPRYDEPSIAQAILTVHLPIVGARDILRRRRRLPDGEIAGGPAVQ